MKAHLRKDRQGDEVWFHNAKIWVIANYTQTNANGTIAHAAVPCRTIDQARSAESYMDASGDYRRIRIATKLPRNQRHETWDCCPEIVKLAAERDKTLGEGA